MTSDSARDAIYFYFRDFAKILHKDLTFQLHSLKLLGGAQNFEFHAKYWLSKFKKFRWLENGTPVALLLMIDQCRH